MPLSEEYQEHSFNNIVDILTAEKSSKSYLKVYLFFLFCFSFSSVVFYPPYYARTRTKFRYGSITQASTIKLGTDPSGKDFYWPLGNLLPLVHPQDIIVDGWDIAGDNLADAMKRAKVLDYNLQEKLAPMMVDMKPRPSIYFPDFIAANQVPVFLEKKIIIVFFYSFRINPYHFFTSETDLSMKNLKILIVEMGK